jgi:hypothetical protein
MTSASEKMEFSDVPILNIKIEEENLRNNWLEFIWCAENKKPKNFTDLVRTLATCTGFWPL